MEHITGPCRSWFGPPFILDCVWWQQRQPHCRLLPPGEAQRWRGFLPCHHGTVLAVAALGMEPVLSAGWQLCDCPQSLSHAPGLPCRLLPARWELEQLCLRSLPLSSSSGSILLSLTSTQVPPHCPLQLALRAASDVPSNQLMLHSSRNYWRRPGQLWGRGQDVPGAGSSSMEQDVCRAWAHSFPPHPDLHSQTSSAALC